MVETEDISEDGSGAVRPRLLLADDSPTIRKVVELTFADEGIEVTAVGDASSAMGEFVTTQPNIVLVDINLPGTSGYQICEMIKQDEATARIPVLLLVGSFEPFDQDEAERVCADGFLLKPFKSIRELVGRVKELLEPAAGSREEPEDVDRTIDAISEFPSDDPGEIVSETNDIENLYKQSLIDTAEIQEFDTVDDLQIDAGMDDELIDMEQYSATEPVDDSNVPEMQVANTVADPTDPFFSRVSESGSAETELLEGIGSGNGIDRSALSGPAAIQPAGQSVASEPSDELIDLIANRVIERLSKREIREVAREVVPRIAEKLIREALAEEKKS